jgi:hypothetical protein
MTPQINGNPDRNSNQNPVAHFADIWLSTEKQLG